MFITILIFFVILVIVLNIIAAIINDISEKREKRRIFWEKYGHYYNLIKDFQKKDKAIETTNNIIDTNIKQEDLEKGFDYCLDILNPILKEKYKRIIGWNPFLTGPTTRKFLFIEIFEVFHKYGMEAEAGLKFELWLDRPN